MPITRSQFPFQAVCRPCGIHASLPLACQMGPSRFIRSGHNNLNISAFITFKYPSHEALSSNVLLQVDTIAALPPTCKLIKQTNRIV